MNKLILFCLSLALSCHAYAQRTVGNGGGLAELKVIYLHQNLASFLRPCLVTSNPCALSFAERHAFEGMLQVDVSERRDVVIRFEPGIPTLDPVRTESRLGAEIVISNQALYDAQGVDHPVSELSALILAARWSHISQAPFSQILNRSREIMLSFRDTGSRTPLLSQTFFFHVAQLSFGSRQETLIILEDGAKSEDLTTPISAVLPCGEIADWRFSNPRASMTGNHLFIVADAVTTCTPDTLSILIEIPVVNSEFVLGQARVILRAGF